MKANAHPLSLYDSITDAPLVPRALVCGVADFKTIEAQPLLYEEMFSFRG